MSISVNSENSSGLGTIPDLFKALNVSTQISFPVGASLVRSSGSKLCVYQKSNSKITSHFVFFFQVFQIDAMDPKQEILWHMGLLR